VNELAPRRPSSLLAGLAQAMSATAEAAKIDVTARCRENATTYVERTRATSVDGLAALRSAAESDIATLRERCDAQIERLRVDTETHVARRQEILQQQLAQLDPAAETEAARVQERVAAFEAEMARLFEQLMQTTDAMTFADLASRMPSSPVFGGEPELPVPPPLRMDHLAAQRPSGGNGTGNGNGNGTGNGNGNGPAPVASSRAPLLPGALSGAGAVRGRLYWEWYGEVARLREIGDEAGAVALLLDVVAGTEAESQADGSNIAPTPYQELAAIYRGHSDNEAETSLLERFARQQHTAGAATSQLLDRLAALKKSKR
jgi:hypothetical protein